MTPPAPAPIDIELLLDGDGHSLRGHCGHCGIHVGNDDPNHRVSSIMHGGRGVECVVRGDIHPSDGGILRHPQDAPG